MNELFLKLIGNDKIAENTFRATFKCDDNKFFEEFIPGQFMQFKIPNAGQLILRRPIAVEKIDKAQNIFSICYFLVGEGTKILSQQTIGQDISAIGPIGNGFCAHKYKNIWLLGGGVGAAPLFSVLQQNPKSCKKAFLGFSSKDFVYNLDNFAKLCELTTCTDDGSYGYKGFSISALMQQLENEKPDAIFACGTGNMLKAVQKAVLPTGIDCYISMESRMGCGIGTCLVCNCKVKKGEDWDYKRVCVDGPVFSIKEVVFDE